MNIEPPENPGVSAGARVARETRRSSLSIYLPWAITATLSLALVLIGIAGRREMRDTANLQPALPILNDPATKDVPFGETKKPSKGRIFISPDKGVVFLGAGLPEIGSGKTFELWIVPAKGNPMAAGLFRSQADATAVFIHRGPVDNAAAVEVTVEPAGGSPQPTTTPFIVARF